MRSMLRGESKLGASGLWELLDEKFIGRVAAEGFLFSAKPAGRPLDGSTDPQHEENAA